MRRAVPVAAVLAFASGLFAAADPFAGTWKLNTAKSVYTKGAPPKEETVSIVESGDQLEVTIKGTGADGSAISTRYTMPTAGGAAKITEGPYDAISAKKTNFYTREITYSKGGKEIIVFRAVAAKDKRSIRVTVVRGTDLQGKPVKGTTVFDKQ